MEDTQPVTGPLWSPVLCHHLLPLEKLDPSKPNSELFQLRKRPEYASPAQVWQRSLSSINRNVIRAGTDIYGYYITSSVLYINNSELYSTGSEDMNLKFGLFKQNWTQSMAVHLLLFFLFL